MKRWRFFSFLACLIVLGFLFLSASGRAQVDRGTITGNSADSGQAGSIGATERPMDAVRQLRMDVAGISAVAGRTGGGAFVFRFGNGTNHLHRTAFGSFKNKFLDANGWEDDSFRSRQESTDSFLIAVTQRKPGYPRLTWTPGNGETAAV